MKYIKKFNEDLDPQTYRSAAAQHRAYGKSQSIEKSHKLDDWADSQQFGFYNMHFACGQSKVVTGPFTKPELIGIYYGDLPSGKDANDAIYADFIRNNNIKSGNFIEPKAEELVNNWMEGGTPLSITFEFGLKPTNETIVASKNHNYLASGNRSGRWINSVPAFSIELQLNDWSEGLEEYDSEAKWEAEHDGREFTPSSAADVYEWNSCELWTIQKPLSQYYSAIFSDRKSAQKFLGFFRETMQSPIVKECIRMPLGIINTTGEQVEKVFKSYEKVRVHGLYDEKVGPLPSGKTYNDYWFNKTI